MKQDGNKVTKKLLEAKLATKVKKKYAHLRWRYNDPTSQKGIPDYIVMQKRIPTNPNPKSSFVEFKCVPNYLKDYTELTHTTPKIRKDGRQEQLDFIKNYLSNSCVINYNEKVQEVEEFVWENSSIYRRLSNTAINKINMHKPKLILIHSCTLKNIKILSLEDMT